MTDVKSQESKDCSSGVPGRNEDSAQGGKEAREGRGRKGARSPLVHYYLFLVVGECLFPLTLCSPSSGK